MPVLIAVSLLTFLIASLLPGDLAYVILGDQATPEKVEALRHDMGLDQPVWWRYLSWLGHVLQGDFGRSFRTGQTVLQAVAERLPVSIELMLLAEIIGLAIGVPLAIACAVRSGSIFDRFMTGTAFGMLSVPAFLSAILLIYLFAVELRWLPATGYVPFQEDPTGNLRFFVLPALTLAVAEWPGIMRVLRSDMIATLQEDYIALAKAKGLKASRILFVHALKPSSLTLVTITGINIGQSNYDPEDEIAMPSGATLTVYADGTFKPVEVDDPAQHVMHEERYTVPEETAASYARTRESGGRVWAVGTTTVRTLESAVDDAGDVRSGSGETRIFLRPPARPRAVDARAIRQGTQGSAPPYSGISATIAPPWSDCRRCASCVLSVANILARKFVGALHKHVWSRPGRVCEEYL
jgi:peptide/nickel transport system permease protein